MGPIEPMGPGAQQDQWGPIGPMGPMRTGVREAPKRGNGATGLNGAHWADGANKANGAYWLD